jgi:C-terminal processing protease CtpA/Prc
MSMVRERIELRPVKWEIKDDVGYININTFSGNVAAEAAGATDFDGAHNVSRMMMSSSAWFPTMKS